MSSNSNSVGDKKKDYIELFYWGGNFAGRGEYVRLMLSYCGFPWKDVSREEKSSDTAFSFIRLYRGKANDKYDKGHLYPVMWPPIIADHMTNNDVGNDRKRKAPGDDDGGDEAAEDKQQFEPIVMNQTPAILTYLARRSMELAAKEGVTNVNGDAYPSNLIPSNPIDEAHMNQLMLAAFDCLSGAEQAHHPVNAHDSYVSQKKEADESMKKFVADRLNMYLMQFEKVFERQKSKPYLVGSNLTIADLVVYNLMRGYRSTLKDHYEANTTIPLLKQHTVHMEALPPIKAFLESDHCTKLEAETSKPDAQEPYVQTNSFM